MRTFKEKNNPNTQVNFNKATEIPYWAKKLGVHPQEFQQKFQELGYSVSQTISYFTQQQQKAVA